MGRREAVFLTMNMLEYNHVLACGFTMDGGTLASHKWEYSAYQTFKSKYFPYC